MVPDKVLELAKQCEEPNKNDIDAAVKCWLKKVVKVKGFDGWCMELVEDAGRHMMHDIRHSRNVRTKKAAGEYGKVPKVRLSKAVGEVHLKRYFDYAMNGTRLGDILFSELPGIAAEQRGKAKGFTFNAKLCDAIFKRAPKSNKEVTIQSKLNHSTLEKIFVALKN